MGNNYSNLKILVGLYSIQTVYSVSVNMNAQSTRAHGATRNKTYAKTESVRYSGPRMRSHFIITTLFIHFSYRTQHLVHALVCDLILCGFYFSMQYSDYGTFVRAPGIILPLNEAKGC